MSDSRTPVAIAEQGPLRLAVIGDVHLQWEAADIAWFDDAAYDALLFVGDLAGYTHRGGLSVARSIARLRTLALVMPGNHDGVTAAQLVAEVVRSKPLVWLTSSGQARRCRALEHALSPVPMVGYSVHRIAARGRTVSVVAARPHSMGGSYIAFQPYLRRRFGIATIEDSAARLCRLVDSVVDRHVVFFAHSGPTGLGDNRDAPWGCDFRSQEGDFGDDDLRIAIEHAQSRGKHVLAVVAGHMHHALRGGGSRRWLADVEGTLYVNAARVPRIETRRGRRRRHHICLTLRPDGAVAEEVWV